MIKTPFHLIEAEQMTTVVTFLVQYPWTKLRHSKSEFSNWCFAYPSWYISSIQSMLKYRILYSFMASNFHYVTRIFVFEYSTMKRNQLNTDSYGLTEINRHCLLSKINVIMIFCHSILFSIQCYGGKWTGNQ